MSITSIFSRRPQEATLYATLQQENAALRQRITELEAQVAELTLQRDAATQRAEQAEAALKQPRIKPKTPPREKKARKKRERAYHRPHENATRSEAHVPEVCPDCGRPLLGTATEHHHRQVIEIVLPRYEVVDHITYTKWCGHCQHQVSATPTPEETQAPAHARFGLGLMAYVTNLAIAHRMPIDQIVDLLERAHGLHLSAGEIIAILHRVATAGQDDLAQLLTAVRAADFAHGDETGWRENGANGYLWQLSTPDSCYIAFNLHRSADVPASLLGEEFTGVLIADFYGGYSPLPCRKQRCWTHFLRHLKELKEASPEVTPFVDAVRTLYYEAKTHVAQAGYARWPEADRIACRLRFEERALDIARPHLKQPEDPARVLAERIERFLSELFVFVECPEIPSENNPAERNFRPIVIARKICGGSRTDKGTHTKMTLISLFATWKLRGIDPLQAIRRLLLGQSTLTLTE